MIIRLSKSISILARYVSKRPNSPYWQFCLRVPNDLRDRYASPWIRQSLKTTDEREAISAADKLVALHEATFAAMRGNSNLTPAQTQMAAQALADRLGPMETASGYFSDLFNAYAAKNGFAKVDPAIAEEMIKESDYLDPVQMKALALIRKGTAEAPRLSAALSTYLANHKNAGKKRFVAQATRDWERLVTLAGDIAITDLGSDHRRLYLSHCAAQGMKSGSVRRCINNVSAILNFGIRELDIRGAVNPFARVSIPREGRDAKVVKTPSPAELHEILERFRSDTKETGLIVLLQMGLGTRVGEITGLLVSDMKLDAETPHIVFREWGDRDLKTDNSARKTPLVGFALDAAKLAVKKAGKNPALFARYAKENGNTNASAAVNKRLQQWAIGTHGFRHAMTDLLRAAGCPADIRKAITGHAPDGVSENYGEGFALKQRAEWLTKALALIQPAKADPGATEALPEAAEATA